jgi:signal transduction histidine kinase
MVRRLREAGTRMLNVEKLAAMGTLAAGVAHEINNPLSFVLANLEYLGQELSALPLDPAERERLAPALADALEGVARVRAIVRDMRLFSGKADEARLAIDVRPVLESSIHLAGNQIRHAARLVKDLREVPRVLASAQRLSQVFVNLLVNAAQAIQRGRSADDEIRVRTLFERGRVVVEVTDTGEGIPEENLARLFDPFFTTKPVGEGTGLGLSICHGIVSALGGTIEVESKHGTGSTFRVLLPPAPAGEQPAVTPHELPAPPSTPPEARAAPPAA